MKNHLDAENCIKKYLLSYSATIKLIFKAGKLLSNFRIFPSVIEEEKKLDAIIVGQLDILLGNVPTVETVCFVLSRWREEKA